MTDTPNTNEMLPFNYSGSGSPLEDSPYYSRTVTHQLHPRMDIPQEGLPSNYVLLGFRPGFPLQAAELNEMQENFFLQQTLTCSMNHNWITSTTPTTWSRGDNITLPNGLNAIGNGNSVELDDEIISDDFAVMGPGWKGATPLFPFNNPDPDAWSGSESYLDPSGAQQHRLIEITETESQLNVIFNKGWYLVELRKDQTGTVPGLQDGFKYWSFLDRDIELNGLPKGNDAPYSVGFYMNIESVNACQESSGCAGYPYDDSLNDSSGGQPNVNTGGADRIRIKFTQAVSSNFQSDNIDKNISNTFYVIPDRGEVRYMNNLLLHRWDN